MSRTVGKYRVLKSLAAGGMAEIFLAKLRGPEGFEKLVVVKQILPHLVKNSDFVRMFLDEARLAAQLQHPNIVQIFELGVDQPTGSYFIAMEHIHGETLRQLTKDAWGKQQPLPIEFGAKIIGQACEGLYYAHTKTDASGKPFNVVHRDISPQNLILSFDGLCKIVDFGIAKASTQLVETQAGVLKGKYAYMSPEQCRGFPLDGRSDLFALGICFYELLTGKGLYRQPNELMIMRAIVEEPTAPPSSIRPEIPPALDAIVMKSLAKKPKDRYQDGMEFSYAIEEYLRDQKRMVSTVHLGAYMRSLFSDKLVEWQKIQEAAQQGSLESELFEEVASEVVGGGFRVGTNPSEQMSGGRLKSDTGGNLPRTATQARAAGMTPAPAPVGGGRLGPGSDNAGAQPLAGIQNTPGPRTTSSPSLARPGQSGRTGAGMLPPPSMRPGSPAPPAPAPASKVPMIVGGLATAALVAVGGYFGISYLNRPPVEVEPPVVVAPPGTGPTVQVKASVLIITDPSMASVAIDGRDTGKKTPCTITDLDTGRKLNLEVTLAGYETHQADLTLSPGENRLPIPPLKKLGGSTGPPVAVASSSPVAATVESEPKGAEVRFDGEFKCKTPCRVDNLTDGKKYKVVVALGGRQDYETELTATKGPAQRIVAELVKKGGGGGRPSTSPTPATANAVGEIQVTCSDPSARISVDGALIGSGGSAKVKVTPGRHSVRAVNASGDAKEASVEVEAGGVVTKHLALQAAAVAAPVNSGGSGPGKLLFIVKPWADVYVNDQMIGTTPFAAKEYPAGSYRVRLVNKDLSADKVFTVKVEADKTTKVVKGMSDP